jgi:hypothetical protein
VTTCDKASLPVLVSKAFEKRVLPRLIFHSREAAADRGSLWPKAGGWPMAREKPLATGRSMRIHKRAGP